MINQSGTQIKNNSAMAARMVMMMINMGAIIPGVPFGLTRVHASSDADYSFLIDSDWHNCQQISNNYQEVYAFETRSFYINICQQGDNYFYSGEAKQSDTNSIFIPATPLEHNRGFQAKNGNISYVVTLPFSSQSNLNSANLASTEAILTIKRNDYLVAVESSLNKYCHQSEAQSATSFAIAFDNIKLNTQTHQQLGKSSLQQQDIGGNLLDNQSASILPQEIFRSNSQFDFYRIDGKLHRIATCN